MEIRKKDLTYAYVPSVCDGASDYSMANEECIVPLATLLEPPYELEFEDSIYARLSATNLFGTSEMSNSGNGAIMKVVPDAPINLVKNTVLSSKSVIAFSWTKADFDGGEEVIDYRIIYDQAEGLYIPLDTTTALSYSTTETPSLELSPGSTYSFAVEARSTVGYSVSSTPL